MGKHKKFQTVKALESAIQKYFDSCVPEYVQDKDGNVMVTAKGVPVVRQNPPTVTGLAYELGFKSRQALINYEEYGEEYHDAIKRAKLYIEREIEVGALTGGLHPVFSIFNLKNNYGWTDRKELEHSGEMKIVELPPGASKL
jgi:hypothetical protein